VRERERRLARDYRSASKKKVERKIKVLGFLGSALFCLNSSEGLFLNHENFGDGARAESWATGDGLLGGHFDRCGLRCQTGLDFRVAQTVQVESSVVVGTIDTDRGGIYRVSNGLMDY
jgi:hypothetical protein